MFEVGRICIKLAGRDAGREAVIVDILEDRFVLIDGNVRRRKCNIMHLEPTSKKIEIKKKADHALVKVEFEKLKFGTWETKPRKTGEKPKKVRKKKVAPVKEEKKKAAKTVKKDTPKTEAKPVKKNTTETKTEKTKATAKKALKKDPVKKKD